MGCDWFWCRSYFIFPNSFSYHSTYSNLIQRELFQTWQLYEEGRLKELVDSNLKEYPEEEVLRYIKVALFCTQASANRRPPMPQVIEMLSKPIRLNEKELTPPGFIEGSMSTSKASKATITSNLRTKDASSSDSSIPFSSAPVTCTELIPRWSILDIGKV